MKFFKATMTAVTRASHCCSEHVFPEGVQRIIVAENSDEAEMKFLATLLNEEAKKNDPTSVNVEGTEEIEDYLPFIPTKVQEEDHVWFDEYQGIVYEVDIKEL